MKHYSICLSMFGNRATQGLIGFDYSLIFSTEQEAIELARTKWKTIHKKGKKMIVVMELPKEETTGKTILRYDNLIKKR